MKEEVKQSGSCLSPTANSKQLSCDSDSDGIVAEK